MKQKNMWLAKVLNLSLIVAVAVGVGSCSTRKVETSKETVKEQTEQTVKETETETTTKQTDTNTKVTTDVKIDTEKNVVSEVTEITAKDETKPASVKLPNGQTIDLTNAKYRNVKTSDLSKEKKVSISEYNKVKKELKKALIQSRKDKETIVKLQKQIKQKKVNKQQYNILSFWWLWLLIILMIYIGYRYRKILFL